MEMPIGRGEGKSKTEFMFVKAREQEVDGRENERFAVEDGFVSSTRSFRYLGTIVDSGLDDTVDAIHRTKAAAKVFGAMSSSIFRERHINPELKGATFKAFVLGILLYGAETWSLTAKIQRIVSSFYNRCVRKMCGITLMEMKTAHIHQKDLERKLGLKSLVFYLRRKRLSWAGHLARMGMNRLPRKFLSSWVGRKRPIGKPKQAFGHGLNKDLKAIGLDRAFWILVAKNRKLWRGMINRV